MRNLFKKKNHGELVKLENFSLLVIVESISERTMERIGCNVTCCRSATCSIDFSWVIDWEGMNGRNYRVTCRFECVHHPRRVERDLERR